MDISRIKKLAGISEASNMSTLDFEHVLYLGSNSDEDIIQHYVQVFNDDIELSSKDIKTMEEEYKISQPQFEGDRVIFVGANIATAAGRQKLNLPARDDDILRFNHWVINLSEFVADKAKTSASYHDSRMTQFGYAYIGFPEFIVEQYPDSIPTTVINYLIAATAYDRGRMLQKVLELNISDPEVQNFVGQVKNLKKIGKGNATEFDWVINAVQNSSKLKRVPSQKITNKFLLKYQARAEKVHNREAERSSILPTFKKQYPNGFEGSVSDGMKLMQKTLPVKVKSTQANLKELESVFGPVEWNTMRYNLKQTYGRYGQETGGLGANVRIFGTIKSSGKPIAYDYYQSDSAEGGRRGFIPPDKKGVQPMSTALNAYRNRSESMNIKRLRELSGLREDDEENDVESSWTPSGEVWALWVSFPYEGKYLCGLYSSRELVEQAWEEMANSGEIDKRGKLSMEELTIDDAPELRYF